jgi:predicted dehydrogenase
VANIAVRAVIPAIGHARRSRLAAIASRSEARAREAAQRLGFHRAHGSYEALLADPEVDAIYIPLPNSMHREWTIRCAQAGKHVLCEKPLGLNAGECEEMAAACRQHRVILMEAFMYRFHPRTERVARLAADGAIGAVHLVRASFTFAVRSPDNIRLIPGLGGGALYDVGCYGVNVSRMILGEPQEAMARADFGTSGVDEVTGAVLRFDRDRLAVVDCGLRISRRQEYEVVGTDGHMTVPLGFLPGTAASEIHLTQGTDRSVVTVPGADQYQLMVEHFEEVTLDGAPLRQPPEDATANMRTIDALYRSMKTGRAEAIGGGAGR